jgi:hypothetical protein
MVEFMKSHFRQELDGYGFAGSITSAQMLKKF